MLSAYLLEHGQILVACPLHRTEFLPPTTLPAATICGELLLHFFRVLFDDFLSRLLFLFCGEVSQRPSIGALINMAKVVSLRFIVSGKHGPWTATLVSGKSTNHEHGLLLQ